MNWFNDQELFDHLWGQYTEAGSLTLDQPLAATTRKSERTCLPAREFRDWITRHVLWVREHADIVAIHQAKLNLFDVFWQYYPLVESPYHFESPDTAHHCLFDEFQKAAYELLQLQRKAAPPRYERIIVQERRIEPETSESFIHLGGKRFKRGST